MAASRPAYQSGLSVVARISVRSPSAGSSSSHAARNPVRRLPDRGLDEDLDGVAPALGQVLLQGAQRVEAGGRRELLRQQLGRGDPVDAQHPPRPGRVRPAQQVPAAMPQHDGPGVDLHRPVRLRRPVDQPQPPPGRARSDQRGRQLGADPDLVIGRRNGDRAHCPDGAGDPLRQHPDDLAEGGAHQVTGVGRVPVTFQDGHDQAHRLGGGERQRRQPQAAPHLVAAVGAADRLDRQVRLAQDGDVAPGGPLGDPEPVAEPLRGDAGSVLDGLERQQRPRGGAQVVRQGPPPSRS